MVAEVQATRARVMATGTIVVTMSLIMAIGVLLLGRC
jgi:hypothetical protein